MMGSMIGTLVAALTLGSAAGPGQDCCPADTDGSGEVDVDDLVSVVIAWGTDGTANNADVDGSGVVDVNDLNAVIVGWGPCSPTTDPLWAWDYAIINAPNQALANTCTLDWTVRITNIGIARSPSSCGRTTVCRMCSQNDWLFECFPSLPIAVPELDPGESFFFDVNNFCLFGAVPGQQFIKADNDWFQAAPPCGGDTARLWCPIGAFDATRHFSHSRRARRWARTASIDEATR